MRANTRRLSVMLVLVAAALLLALPGVAGAHVRAKYRTEYKAKLTSLSKGFNAFARNYDNMKQGSLDAAEVMAPMIGDPNQREQLVDHENWCLTIYNMNKGKPVTWATAYRKPISAFSGKAKLYFATAAQQRKFKSACGKLKAYTSVLIMSANDHLYESYRVLGLDPPALDLAAKAIAEGDEDAATGHEGADKWFAALRAQL
jgi:hypothetical protein